jgi:ribosomal protein S16
MKKVLIAVLVLFIFTLPTCTSDLYNPDVCFQENVLPIFVSKCSMNGCHNSADHKAGYDLTNYDGIMKGIVAKHPFQSEIYNAIRGSNPSMPPQNYPALTKKEIDYIKIWIKMGAKNSSNCSGCDTVNYTYRGRIKPLFDSWCLGCHNTGNAGGGYDFSSYSGIVASITSNRLSGSIQHLSGFSPMPKNTNALSSCDINAIEKWISVGYPQN